MNRHECKHLLSIVMDWLPSFDDYLFPSEFNERSKRKHQLWADYQAGKITADVWIEKSDEEKVSFPEQVANALNIYRHEKIEALGKREPWRDEEWARGFARNLADGRRDKQKQSACFVNIGKTGAVSQLPKFITSDDAKLEIERAKALVETRVTWSEEYSLLKKALTEVFANLHAKSS